MQNNTSTIKNRKVTLTDIAAKAGVSRVAVSKVLLGGTTGNNTRVSQKKSQEIRRIAKELNYRPNLAARQLKGAPSQLIGVLVDSYAPEINFNWLSRMEREAARQGYRFMVGQSHGELKRVRDYVGDFTGRGVDGIICLSHSYPDSWVSSQIDSIFRDLPHVVFVGSPMTEREAHCWVEVDVADGIKQILSHLIATGRQRIGAFLLESESRAMNYRYQGYVEGLRKHGRTLAENLIRRVARPGEVSPEKLTPHVRTLVEDENVDAIIAVNDYTAFMTINILRKMGLAVPDDVAVTGFDNIRMAEHFYPALTTVDQRNTELGKLTVQMLVNMINDKPPEQRHQVIKPALIVRESA